LVLFFSLLELLLLGAEALLVELLLLGAEALLVELLLLGVDFALDAFDL
jgi:hypothetical protein